MGFVFYAFAKAL